jgi:hypothetical protein
MGVKVFLPSKLPKNSIINKQCSVGAPLLDNWINLPVPISTTSNSYKQWVLDGSLRALYFGELAQYMYTTQEKYMGVFNGVLPEKLFHKSGVALHVAALWCLEDMIADAKSKGITISYSSFYKKLSVQEADFKKLNSKTPTKVSKASSIPEIRNGKTWAGNKWYPITLTGLNAYPGFSPLGTGFSIKLQNNNEKVTQYIIDNGAKYGWSWCSDIPTSDPIFKNTLIYYAAATKPLKYKDKTRTLIQDFMPVAGELTSPQYSQFGGNVVISIPLGQISTWKVIPGHPNGGKWVYSTPLPTTKTTKTTNTSQTIQRSSNVNESIPVNRFNTFVVNSTTVSRFAHSVRSTLNYLGINNPTITMKTSYYTWETKGPGKGQYPLKNTVSSTPYSQTYDKFYVAEDNLVYSSDSSVPASSLEYWKNFRRSVELNTINQGGHYETYGTSFNEADLSWFEKPAGGYIMGLAPSTSSVIYYLPELENDIKNIFIPMLNKITLFEGAKYNYILKNVKTSRLTEMENIMRYGLDYAPAYNKYFLKLVLAGKVNIRNNYWTIDKSASPTIRQIELLSEVFPTAVKNWPNNEPTPDNGSRSNWRKIVGKRKTVNLKVSEKVITPFNTLLLLGTGSTFTSGFVPHDSFPLSFTDKLANFATPINRKVQNGYLNALAGVKGTPIIHDGNGNILSNDLAGKKEIDKRFGSKALVIPRSSTVPVKPKVILPSFRPADRYDQTKTAPKTPKTTTPPTTVPSTSTTTVPRTSTTIFPRSSTTIVKPKVILPSFRPADRYDQTKTTILPSATVTLLNKIPLIIGDSISVGISDRYDALNPGTNTREIVPNPYSVNHADSGWDGLFQLLGEGLQAVSTRINNCMSYLDKKNLAKNRIVWLSTGASNSAGNNIASIISCIKGQFDLLKKYNSTVFVYGISNQLDDKYPKKEINKQISDICKQYKYFYMGPFHAPYDGVHPLSYVNIVNALIGAIPKGTVYIPPTITIPAPVITIPSTTSTTTTVLPNGSTTSTTGTTVLPNGSTSTTITRYNPPYIRPPDQRDGPKFAPPSTVVTTTTTTLPNAAVTTTTVLSNGTTTSTTISPPLIPSIPDQRDGPQFAPSTTIPIKVVPTPKTTYPDQRDGPQFAPPAPSVPEPKLLSYEVTSFSTDSDPTRVNIDVRVTLKFDQPMQVNRGTINFVKKNTTKALARINVKSFEISFPDANTIAIAPKNVMPYDTEISVTIAANILKTKLGKSWPGNFGNNANQILFITITDPAIVPPVVAPDVPSEKPRPKPKPKPKPGLPISPVKPVVPEVPVVTPPNETVIDPGNGNIIIVDPVENEKTLQSNDGVWGREDIFSVTKFNAINQNMTVTRFAPHTSWALQFNMLDDAGAIKNIGRIGLERNAPRCIGDPESPSVCFFSIYGGIKTLPDPAVDRYRQAPCEAKVADHGPGMSLRNNLIWRPGDLFQFRVTLSLLQQQEYVVTFQCLSTSRPISPAFSDTIYETDTDRIYMWNGLEWFLIASATLNIIQARTFENINTFIINGIWWSGLVWNRTLRRTYPLGNIFVPTDYTNIDAIKNFVKYSGPESEKSNVAERKASANFISPIGFSLDGIKGVYKAI